MWREGVNLILDVIFNVIFNVVIQWCDLLHFILDCYFFKLILQIRRGGRRVKRK